MASGQPLPKFGDWDVNNPSSAEGFTAIFNIARDEKKTGGNAGAATTPSTNEAGGLEKSDSYQYPRKSGPSIIMASSTTYRYLYNLGSTIKFFSDEIFSTNQDNTIVELNHKLSTEGWRIIQRGMGELQRKCLHLGLEDLVLLHTFYNGLLYNTRLTIDAAAGGALMSKTIDAAFKLLEEMALNHNQWTSERGVLYRLSQGRHESDGWRTLAEKLVFAIMPLKTKGLISKRKGKAPAEPSFPPNPCGILFRDEIQAARYNQLVERKVVATKYANKRTLETLGLHDDVMWMFEEIRAQRFFQMTPPTYLPLVLVFLSSFDVQLYEYTDRHADGEITFRIANEKRSCL